MSTPYCRVAACVRSDASLSRQHALLELRSGQVWVEDLESTNGTYLNGALVESHDSLVDGSKRYAYDSASRLKMSGTA